ncbi:Protoporphyrinogen oxidase [Polyporus arcularius HHB13444]|uniref:Protoporphyrinogen oxidase n=1 Tax=Polyporus arcularius HHB13444 TaxID=1314778 RepID=A0A5C3P5V9_9APHY|nr:Protoporphyrinogen oxidase [Polyporus arcularius HHB13444]
MSFAKSVTVLGGGITGLSAAFHLSRRLPVRSGVCMNILERSNRLGGWVCSDRVHVREGAGDEADILLESGMRTLRPNSKALLELIHLLDLAPYVLTVPRSAPAARNRFLRLPCADGLTTIPTSLASLLTSSLARVLVPAVLQDALRAGQKVLHEDPSEDGSVDAFLTRHFGAKFARMFGSALVHGIYAADSRILSIRAAFPILCQLERRGRSSVVRGAVADTMSFMPQSALSETEATEPYDLGEVPNLMKGVSVYSFREGMQTLTEYMAKHLETRPNVDLGVRRLRKVDGYFEFTTDSGRRFTSTHVVAALPLPQPHCLLEESLSQTSALPALAHLLGNPSSSVTVVNLVFPPSATPIHPDGFGYLIPRPSADYYSAPSLGMLGTVFDSSALSGQDRYPSLAADMRGQFTKLTVMLGGPFGEPAPTPSSPQFIPALLDGLQMHFGRRERLPEPCLVRVREHRDCIPTPTVGHTVRMKELAEAVKERWGPHAAVIGAGVGGVSMGDRVESGRRASIRAFILGTVQTFALTMTFARV